MRVRLDDVQHAESFAGFMQRCRCLVLDHGAGVCEVFLAVDLPERLARAELAAYLSMWEQMTPGGHATLIAEVSKCDVVATRTRRWQSGPPCRPGNQQPTKNGPQP
jgi:hypothetical protein